MRILMLAALAASTAAAVAATPAMAREGCGRGFHRGPAGACRPNRVGQFYRGYGYWDGRRYWQQRYRWHRGWRYR